jgi:HD-GYP domain-containing protein (c-di-GMP phosphodiesterase class II)
MVVTQYLWNDPHRLRLFIRRLNREEHTLARHSVNTFSIGLWLFTNPMPENMSRKSFDQAALALLLHDVGMAKIPAFITGKTTPLKPEEREKIPPHTIAGYKIMHKLDQTYDAMRQATLEHHERLDGSGYPQHIKDISPFGRLTAVADAFSAMLQKHPYAPAMQPMTAAKELTNAKQSFDLSLAGKLLVALLSDAETFGKIT